MKILHCCLANFYIDNYGYQENILPKMHRLQGHEVRIVASTETYIENARLGYIQASSYYTPEGIPITRIPYIKIIPHFIAKKLRIYKGLKGILLEFKPEIIFLHDVQFISIWEIVKYAKYNKVTIYADCHTDLINSATNWVSKNILHKLIYKWCAQKIEPHTKKFYGVLPARVDFLLDIYDIPANKTELLVMGADDTLFDLSKKSEVRKKIRSAHHIKETDFLIISGGKIDRKKNIHHLLEAFQLLDKENVKLLIFGKVNDELEKEIDSFRTSKNIVLIDWLPTHKIYEFLMAADLGFFPGTHSVLWEQSVGIGLPCVFKRWKGIEHVDVGGNCLFLDEISIESIQSAIIQVVENKDLFERMKTAAVEKGIPKFSYSEIAKYSIE